MPPLIVILLGLLGLLLFVGADWATYKEIRFLKPILWFAIIPVASYAVILALMDSASFSFPDTLSKIAWFPLLVFFALFIYSVFIEIPLKTYAGKAQPTKVVTTGTYSLCRHPATLWFIGCLISLVFVSRSVTLAMATPFWIAAYIGCVYIEDILTSKSGFGEDYKKYKCDTPMIIPTKASVICFWNNVRSRFCNS